jgi:hypothetical protein
MRYVILTHLVPCPHRPERIEKANVLEQVRVQPEAGRRGKHRNDEQNESHNGHAEKQSNQPQHAHANVPHTLSQHKWPQREQDNRNNEQ